MKIEANSPVRTALRWVEQFLALEPRPDLGTDASQSAALLVATHQLHLLRGAGLLNLRGYHSAAVTLFRPLEDGLDCFAAVLLIGGAAERWRAGKLRASDAAKEWTSLDVGARARGVSIAEYRKSLRAQFNGLTHCSYELCEWNLYFVPHEAQPLSDSSRGDLQLNTSGASVIYANAHRIDAHLTAHLLELFVMLKRGYSKHLNAVPEQLHEIEHLQQVIIAIMEEHERHQCQQTSPPPEIRRLEYVGEE